MRRILIIGLLFLGAILIEESMLPFLVPGGVALRLVTLLVASLGVCNGSVVGAGVGFGVGIVVSLLTFEPLGLASLALIAVGWTAGRATARFPLATLPARLLLMFGLLALEAAVTFVAGWAFLKVAYRFHFLDLLSATLVSPAVLFLVERVAGSRAPASP
ncbi:MAG: rod shape-determining protein MreD [Candidatus Sumerlaeota bacterium]|nr:rod shape-determining protein MreD [Candidatus Sumerlaeota bacterium]